MKKRVLSVLLVVALMLPLVPTSIFAEKTTDIAEHEEYLFSTNIASEGFWNNNKYSVFDKALSWTEAMEYCAQLGGHLATITTEEEQLFIESLLANGCNQKQYWIGAQRIGNGFEWITNEVWAYENWDYGQPDKSPQNSTDENYLQIYNEPNPVRYPNSIRYSWNDMSNDNTFPGEENFFCLDNVGFICEWDNYDNKDNDADTIDNNSKLQQEWISQHLSYANSNDFKNEIVKGFSGELLNTFRVAIKDTDIRNYKTGLLLQSIFNLNIELSKKETYELLLAQLFYSHDEVFFQDSFAENLECATWNTTQIIYDVVKTGKDSLDLSPSELQEFDSLYKDLKKLKFGSTDFTKSYKKLFGIIQKNKNQIKNKLVTEGTFIIASTIIEYAFERYEALEDITWYLNCYVASQSMTEQTKEVLSKLHSIVCGESEWMSNKENIHEEILTELGLFKGSTDWLSFQEAILSFSNSLDDFQKNGINAVSEYAAQRNNQSDQLVSHNLIKSIGGVFLDSILMCIPTVNVIVMAIKATNTSVSAMIILAQLTTKIQDRAYAYDMLRATYCLSLALYDVVMECKKSLKSNDFYSSTVFDKAVTIYKKNNLLAIAYATNYAKTSLSEKQTELLYSYVLSFDQTMSNFPFQQQVSKLLTIFKSKYQKKLTQLVETYGNCVSNLNQQIIDTQNILCHSDELFYDFNNNRVIYNPQDSRMFIVACPVEMIVFNDSGEQIASLNGKEDSIIDGFEMMFQTVKIPNSSNDYIKIAIVPNTYTVKLQGTGEGVMNAFTAQITSNGVENINSYFDIPVKSNSVGYFDTSSITTPNVVLDDICYQDVASTTSFSKVIWIIFSVIAITTIAILVVIVFNKKKKSTK